METEKLEIILEYANNSYVNLDNMSIEALESFLSVTNALKNIAESVSTDVKFSIKKGSACTAVIGSRSDIYNVYERIEEAIIGESEDEIVTSNLREIQKHIKNEVFKYQFKFSNENIDNRIREAKKIVRKRSKNLYRYELAVLTGYFNSVGGNEPNYHFDYGNGSKTTIECDIPQALEMKNYLYQNISCLVQKKYSADDSNNITYYHCSVIKNEQIGVFRKLSNDLNKTINIFERIDILYDFAENSKSVIEDLAVIVKAYKSMFQDINELKTILILTKSLKSNTLIKDSRKKLLSDFDALMNKI
jgi:hypothetical protein